MGALVEYGARARVLAVADRIPASRTRWKYLECRLAAGATQTDLSIRVEPSETTHPAVEALWFEYDCPNDGRSVDAIVDAPGVFADIRPSVYAGASRRERDAATRRVADSLGSPLPRETAAVIQRCLAALPPGSAIISTGCFPHRDAALRRLCIAGIDDDLLPAYLARIGWPGTWSQIARRLAPLTPLAVRAGRTAAIVHIDVGADVAPTIALELPFTRAPQRGGRLAEVAVLDTLVATGVCDPAKRDALLAWPLRVVSTMPHELWPSVMTRRLNHVKLVWRADGIVEAKAYLAMSHRPIVRRRNDVSIK